MIFLFSGCTSINEVLTTNHNNTTAMNTTNSIERFVGTYTNNGKTQKTKEVASILSVIENQSINDSITHGDMIYNYVADKEDCFPSAEHPIYSVLLEVTDKCPFKQDYYNVYYLIGLENNYSLDLSYCISYNLEEVFLVEISLRDKTTQTDKLSLFYEDFSSSEMNSALYNIIAEYMPDLYKRSTASDTTSITIQNFESFVDISNETSSTEYLFEMFFDEKLSDSNDSWEYIGKSYNTFAIPEYDFYSFEIYKVGNEYYMFPFNEYTSAPTVYKFVENSTLELVWTPEF